MDPLLIVEKGEKVGLNVLSRDDTMHKAAKILLEGKLYGITILMDPSPVFPLTELESSDRPPHIMILHFKHGNIVEDVLLYILHTCPSLENIHLIDINRGAIGNETLL
ncbi:hypothetical protein DFS33DRAFT_1270016 [Desarmillaria ectypa]|nr:hypothetical protein DFS33DRAFT_1270016 [Desarmillaria ectypa]